MIGLPTVLSEIEANEFYKNTPEGYLVQGNTNNLVMRAEEVEKAGENLSAYLLKTEDGVTHITYEDIRAVLTQKNEILDNIHRGYVYTSATYSADKDKLIKEYNSPNNRLTYVELQNSLQAIDRKFQEDYIYLLVNGLTAWPHSDFVNKEIDNFVEKEMLADYMNGKYSNPYTEFKERDITFALLKKWQ